MVSRFIKVLFLTISVLAGLTFDVQYAEALSTPKSAEEYVDWEQINQFESKIYVLKNGSLEITETIDYNFGYDPRHGIFRYIPFKYEYNGKLPSNAVDGSKFHRETPIKVKAVSRDGNSNENYEVFDEGNFKVIKIGDKDKTIDGKHRYTISYTISNFVNSFEDIDELYLNIIGNGWLVPIALLKAEITIEGATSETQFETICFRGVLGSTARCTNETKMQGNKISIEENDLSGGEGVTVVAAIPQGILSPEPQIIKEDWTWASNFRITPLTLSGFFLVLVKSMGVVCFLLYKNGRDRRFVGSAVDAAMGNTTGDEVIKPLWGNSSDPVEFVPPDNIRPGQIGVLVDEKVDDVDLTATLIDLAVRGYFHITEVPQEKMSLFGNKKTVTHYWIEKTKRYENDNELNIYERKLLSGMFDEKDKFYLSELTETQAIKIDEVRLEIMNNSVESGFFKVRPDKVRSKWNIIGNVAIALSIGILILGAFFTHFALIFLPLVFSAIMLRVFAKRMPSRTSKGTAMVGRVAGFRQLFDVGEGERQAFAEKANLFTKYLPYAIVFGCADKWAQVFEGLGLSAEQMGLASFYSGAGYFSPMNFTHTMNTFSTASINTVSTSLASGSFSSGGSGFSGGFSGGGGGGGGGGSW